MDMAQLPAEPMLASALWQAHKNKRGIDGSPEETDLPIVSYLKTGCKSVDSAIHPGLPYGTGSITCLSNEVDAGGKELLFSFLVSHLLSSPDSTATVIDSVGLDLLALFSTIKAHLSRQPHINPNLPPRDLDQEATALLERLSIMRVFSFEGLAEALSEFKSTCDSHATSPANSPTPNRPPMKSTIPDSQANEEDEDLFALQDQEPTTTNHPSPSPQPSPQAQPPSSPILRKLLIIDDLPTIFTPLQRQSCTQSSALLASLLRSTHHLANSHPLSVLLMNSTYAPAPSRPSPRRPDDTATAPERKPPPRGPSIFASCAARPMFGHVLDQGTGLHCLVHRVPRTAGDAGRAYGEKEGEGRERGRGAGWVNCLEVVGDREGVRGQRFGFFEVGRGGLVGDWSGGGR